MLGSRRKGRQGTGVPTRGPQSHTISSNHRTSHGHRKVSHFSLQDEARNTERQHNWGLSTQLRHAKINFVSSKRHDSEEVTQVNGSGEAQAVPFREASSAVKDSSLENSISRMSLNNHDKTSVLGHTLYDEPRRSVDRVNSDHSSNAVGSTRDGCVNSNDAFVLDEKGNLEEAETGFPNPEILERSSSPTPSASSEDIIVFKGRRNMVPSSIPKRNYQTTITSIDDPPPFAAIDDDPLVPQIATKHDLATATVSAGGIMNGDPSYKFKARSGNAQRLEESALDDYIANMDPILAAMTTMDELAGDAKIISGLQTSGPPEQGTQAGLMHEKDIGEQLGSSDAKRASVPWSEADGSDYSVDSDSDNEEEDDLRWEVDNITAEEENFHDRNENMTDSQIARLLAKQEELGLGSDEVILFDGANGVDSSSTMALSGNYPSSGKMSSRKSRKIRRSELASKGNDSDLAAEALFGSSSLHGPCHNFDPMDFERPGLQRKRKGRKDALDFDLSDSDLAAQMATTWNNDRVKKKSRKEERQRQREQTWDVQENGSSGIGGLGDAKRQICAFLQSEKTSLSFPPMNKRDRRALHELANRLTLTSKSHGNGHKRFPVLYRTKRTPNLSDDHFDRIVEQLSRRFSDLRTSKPPKRNTTGVTRNGGYSHAAVSCRDGEVVGAGAAELGHENRGRVMLEKMGWSTGTAIGAPNNKGIMQPVVHVVKTTKAGLG